MGTVPECVRVVRARDGSASFTCGPDLGIFLLHLLDCQSRCLRLSRRLLASQVGGRVPRRLRHHTKGSTKGVHLRGEQALRVGLRRRRRCLGRRLCERERHRLRHALRVRHSRGSSRRVGVGLG